VESVSQQGARVFLICQAGELINGFPICMKIPSGPLRRCGEIFWGTRESSGREEAGRKSHSHTNPRRCPFIFYRAQTHFL
jgi:hypothetical protein